ncbi:MAG: ABC transporter ATP-binding protein [Hyphomicrobiaceae bacterium]
MERTLSIEQAHSDLKFEPEAAVRSSFRQPGPGRLDRSIWMLLRRFVSDWLWPRRALILRILLLTALLAAVTGGYPLIIKLSFDALLAGQTDLLPIVLASIVAVTAARSVLLYTQSIETQKLVIGVGTDLRKSGFARLLSLDFLRVSRDPAGAHVSRLTNEVTFIENGIGAALNSAVRDPLSIAVLVGTMFYLDWVMSAVVLLVYPIAILPILTISRRLLSVAKRTQSGLGSMTSLLTEYFQATRLIKSYRLEGYASERAGDSFDTLRDLRLKAARNKARIDPLLEALGGVAVAGVIALATWRVSSGASTVGDFMGFVSALLMAAQPIRGLGKLSANLQEAFAAIERFYELADEIPHIVDRPNAAALRVRAGEIRFETVSFAFPSRSDVLALDGVSLVAPPGATVALVGRSGSGKSTLINLVPRLFDADKGRVLIDGQDVRDVTLASLRGSIAVVSQDVTLFDDTIRANIAIARQAASEDQIVAAARAAAAHEFIAALPQGYDTRVGDGGGRLSGGQRQRIALARAFLTEAPILLLDEATSALDAESEQLVQAALQRFASARTTLVIAHRLSTVQRADMICVMDRGRIVETGTHADLMGADGLYATLVKTQLSGDAALP